MYLNDRFLQPGQAGVDPKDRGMTFADGVYEVVRAYDARLLGVDEHFQRMVRGLRALRIEAEDRARALPAVSQELLRRAGLSQAKVYWQITRGVDLNRAYLPDPGLHPTVLAWAEPCPQMEPPGEVPTAKAVLQPDERWARCDLKTTMLLPAVLAGMAAQDAGADLAILHREGTVTEATAANALICQSGTIRTHPLGRHILAGITRGILLRIAAELGIPVVEEPFSVADLLAADEAWVCGTTRHLTAITAVDAQPIGDGGVGPLARQLHTAFVNHVQSR
jgi:D-alanine transaminase